MPDCPVRFTFCLTNHNTRIHIRYGKRNKQGADEPGEALQVNALEELFYSGLARDILIP
jgi:hypothetical protein